MGNQAPEPLSLLMYVALTLLGLNVLFRIPFLGSGLLYLLHHGMGHLIHDHEREGMIVAGAIGWLLVLSVPGTICIAALIENYWLIADNLLFIWFMTLVFGTFNSHA